MIDKRLFRLFFLLILVAVTGCVRPVAPVERPARIGYQETIARLKSRAEYYSGYQARLRVRAQGPKGRIQFQAVMLAGLPGRFRLEALNPFGQTVGLLLLDQENSLLWLPSENVVYTAARPETLVQHFLGVRIPLETFGYSLIASATPSQLNDLQFYEKAGMLCAKVRTEATAEYTWNLLPSPLSLESLEVREGGTEYTITYDPPADLAIAETPRKIKFTSSQWEMEVTVNQLARAPDLQEKAFRFPVPQGPREIRLSDSK